MRPISVLTAAVLLGGVLASSAHAGFRCSSSAGRALSAGRTVEPVTVTSAGDCTTQSRSLPASAFGGPASLSGSLIARTEVYPAHKGVLAAGGATQFAVAAPTLPVGLHQVPDALETTVGSVLEEHLSEVKAAMTLPTNLVSGGGADRPVGLLPDDVSGVLGRRGGRNTALNARNVALNKANRARNATIAEITLTDALLATVRAVLKPPAVDLVRVKRAMAHAVGSCQTGTPQVDGSSTVEGVVVAGHTVTVDDVLELSQPITATTDLAGAALSLRDLGLSPEHAALVSAATAAKLAEVNRALRDALRDLGRVEIPLGVAHVRLTPGTQTRSSDSVTQRALMVEVSMAGQRLVHALIGEATASASGVDCAEPVVDPETPSGVVLGCATRRLVLVDVLEHRGRVRLFGIADPALAGRRVRIVFDATGEEVATASVSDDGSFATTAPLPPAEIRGTNAARYQAVLGDEESINLKLRRRMLVDSMTSRDRHVTIVGRVLPPLATPLEEITLTRRVSCSEERVVTRFRPRGDGSFRVTVVAPAGLGAVVYRMTTRVRYSATGTALFKTYTLPRAIDVVD